MSAPQASGKSGWLLSLLGEKRARLAHLFAEIAGLGIPAFMKPEKYRRFIQLLSQIHDEKGSEAELISAIEAVELEHHRRRDHNQLEHADPSFVPPAEVLNHQNRKGIWEALRMWLQPQGKNISE